ncbi:MAG: hypothetical protein E5Y74_36015, partial [Mesorhizobium sp.]
MSSLQGSEGGSDLVRTFVGRGGSTRTKNCRWPVETAEAVEAISSREHSQFGTFRSQPGWVPRWEE